MGLNKRIAVMLALALVWATTGCKSKSQQADGEGLRVVTTIGMLADMARELGGECVAASALMGPGVDPHLFRASGRDIDTLTSAHLILFGGHGLEGKMGDVLERVGQRIPTLATLETLDESVLLGMPNLPGHHDPHVWMDVSLWSEVSVAVEQQLVELRPDCSEDVAARSEQYRSQLQALHNWTTATLASIPEEQRAMVTAHDAFSYFGRAYDIDVFGIQGVSTEAEASVADIQETVSLIVQRRIPAIFVESSINPRNIEAVRAAVENAGWSVSIGEQLFSDAMGEAGTWRGTYVGMIRNNVLSIATALGGQAASWPDELQGWANNWEIE